MLVSMGVQTLLLITLWMRRVMTAWVKMTHDDSWHMKLGVAGIAGRL